MGLQQLIGADLQSALMGWVKAQDERLPENHSFLTTVENLTWLNKASKNMVEGAKKALYLTGIIVIEAVGLIFTAIEGLHGVLGTTMGKRKIEAIQVKGYELFKHTVDDLARLIYTATKVLLLYTGEESLDTLITRQENECMANDLQEGYYLQITSQDKKGYKNLEPEHTKERVINPTDSVLQDKLLDLIWSGKKLEDSKVTVGSFSKGMQGKAATLLSKNLSPAQQNHLTTLAQSTAGQDLRALRRELPDNELLIERLERALKLGVNRLQVDHKTIWVIRNFIDQEGAKATAAINLLRQVQVFDIVPALDSHLDFNTFGVVKRALTGIHRALDENDPWKHLFFVQTDDQTISQVSKVKGNTVMDKVYPYMNNYLSSVQKKRLTEALKNSVTKARLPKSPLLYSNTQKKDAGINLTAYPISNDQLWDFFRLDRKSVSILNFMRSRAWPTILYQWKSDTDLDRLQLGKQSGLHFQSQKDLDNFSRACNTLKGSLPVTDIVCDFLPTQGVFAAIQPKLSLEKVHLNCSGKSDVLVEELDELGIYTLQMEDEKLNIKTQLAAQDIDNVRQYLLAESEKIPRPSVFSNEAYKHFSLGEMRKLLTTAEVTAKIKDKIVEPFGKAFCPLPTEEDERWKEQEARDFMSMAQVLKLFECNRSAKDELDVALQKIPELQSCKSFKARLTKVFDWDVELIHERLQSYVASLLPIWDQVDKFNRLGEVYNFNLHGADLASLTRVSKALGLPIFVPPNHLMTEAVCKVVNEARVPLFMCVEPHTLRINLENIQKLEKDTPVYVIPVMSSKWKAWQMKPNASDALYQEWVGLKALVERLKEKGIKIKYVLPQGTRAHPEASKYKVFLKKYGPQLTTVHEVNEEESMDPSDSTRSLLEMATSSHNSSSDTDSAAINGVDICMEKLPSDFQHLLFFLEPYQKIRKQAKSREAARAVMEFLIGTDPTDRQLLGKVVR